MGRSLYNTVVIKIYHMITQIVYCPVTKSGNAIFLGIRKPPLLRGFSFEVIYLLSGSFTSSFFWILLTGSENMSFPHSFNNLLARI